MFSKLYQGIRSRVERRERFSLFWNKKEVQLRNKNKPAVVRIKTQGLTFSTEMGCLLVFIYNWGHNRDKLREHLSLQQLLGIVTEFLVGFPLFSSIVYLELHETTGTNIYLVKMEKHSLLHFPLSQTNAPIVRCVNLNPRVGWWWVEQTKFK